MTDRRQLLARFALPLAASTVALLVTTNPAAAAVDDSFEVYTTTDYCGSAEFVDYGPGAPGGGNNDDYVLIHDYCPDGHGVRAEAKKLVLDANGNPTWVSLGRQYNGNGYAGPPKVWDPFGNILPGTTFSLRVCLVDGASDPTPFRCKEKSEYSNDG